VIGYLLKILFRVLRVIILSKSKYGILTCNYKLSKRIYKNKMEVIKYPKTGI